MPFRLGAFIMRYVKYGSVLFVLPLLASSVRVYQTNSAGDEVHVIDPATNKVVQTIKDIEVPHGVTFSPDGKRAYITCEAEKTVWAVDTKNATLIAKALSADIRIISPFQRTGNGYSLQSPWLRAQWMLSTRPR